MYGKHRKKEKICGKHNKEITSFLEMKFGVTEKKWTIYIVKEKKCTNIMDEETSTLRLYVNKKTEKDIEPNLTIDKQRKQAEKDFEA